MGRLFTLLAPAGPDIAVDLGTANTLVFVRGEGIVLGEPSVVALDARAGSVCAVGAKAKAMLGRTPAYITATRPLKDGVIKDVDVTQQMLSYFIREARGGRRSRPRVMVCVPSGLTAVERRAVLDATYAAGARKALLITEPMAAAIGSGLPVAEPSGSLVVDVGGGTTEVAVISLGDIVASRSIRIAGDALDEAIALHVRSRYGFAISVEQAELVKLEAGALVPGSGRSAEVRGRDLARGLPRTIVLHGDDLVPVLEPVARHITAAVVDTLEQTPPELAADVIDRGLMLAGGGALLPGLDRRLQDATGLEVHTTEAPLECVALGAGRSLETLSVRAPTLPGLKATPA